MIPAAAKYCTTTGTGSVHVVRISPSSDPLLGPTAVEERAVFAMVRYSTLRLPSFSLASVAYLPFSPASGMPVLLGRFSHGRARNKSAVGVIRGAVNEPMPRSTNSGQGRIDAGCLSVQSVAAACSLQPSSSKAARSH